MRKNKTYAGYINLKPINGIIFPSYIQNQMNKKFIVEELESDFFLSTNENMYSENDIVLNSLIKERNNLNGIVMLSAFSLPEKFENRERIYRNLLKNKKTLHFIFEKTLFQKKEDIVKIENYLIFRDSFFTNTKKKLSNFEKKKFLDRNWEYI